MYINETQQQSTFQQSALQQSLFPTTDVGRKTKAQPVETAENKEVIFSVASSDWISLRVLFLRHMKQQRWIYFLNKDLALKTNNYPVLQVKLNEDQKQFDAIQKIIHFGQAGAIIIEQPQLTQQQLNELKLACLKQNVILILLDNQLEQCH